MCVRVCGRDQGRRELGGGAWTTWTTSSLWDENTQSEAFSSLSVRVSVCVCVCVLLLSKGPAPSQKLLRPSNESSAPCSPPRHVFLSFYSCFSAEIFLRLIYCTVVTGECFRSDTTQQWGALVRWGQCHPGGGYSCVRVSEQDFFFFFNRVSSFVLRSSVLVLLIQSVDEGRCS